MKNIINILKKTFVGSSFMNVPFVVLMVLLIGGSKVLFPDVALKDMVFAFIFVAFVLAKLYIYLKDKSKSIDMLKYLLIPFGMGLTFLIIHFIKNPILYNNKSFVNNDKIVKVSVGDKEEQKAINVRSHVYTIINKEKDLKRLEHTLSYVILPRNLSGHSSKITATYKRYLHVIEQIQELRKIHKNDVMVQKSLPFPRTDNHFVLFKKGEDDSRVTLDNYNYELSFKVLDFFRENYPNVHLDKDGPYIITTARNVMNGVENFSFLYINLSTFNNSAVKEAIESYKKRLVDRGNSDIEKLEGWRYSLLSALSNFNADIHIVRSAMAGEL